MKVLIAYAGKTGTTAKAASILSEALLARNVDVDTCDLTATPILPQGYDAVAVGGSIRMGKLHKKALSFLKDNRTKLLAFPLGIFCCRCGKDDTRALLSAQINAELLAHALSIVSFGGELDPSQQKGLDRFVVNVISKADHEGAMKPEGIQRERIQQFADTLVGTVHHG
ncbi:MAG: flavodoxin domain-containing protein [Eubacteriales bacterium]|nr:flavodoxin domain-containing protein [Eubacteriales bacterium]